MISHSRPKRAAAAAVWRTWFDCTAPWVTRVSASLARASPSRNSSLRVLLPPPARPVQSSRLIHSVGPPPDASVRRQPRAGAPAAWAGGRSGRGGSGRDASRRLSRRGQAFADLPYGWARSCYVAVKKRDAARFSARLLPQPRASPEGRALFQKPHGFDQDHLLGGGPAVCARWPPATSTCVIGGGAAKECAERGDQRAARTTPRSPSAP